MTIAVIDPAGRKLIDAANPNSLLDLAADLDDFVTARGRGIGNQTRYIGMMEAAWKGVLFGTPQRRAWGSTQAKPAQAHRFHPKQPRRSGSTRATSI